MVERERQLVAAATEAPLAEPAPRWRRLLGGALLAKFLLTTLLVWITVTPTLGGGCGEPSRMGPPEPPFTMRGWEVLQGSHGFWRLFVPLAAWIVFRIFVRPRRRHALYELAAVLLRMAVVTMTLSQLVTIAWHQDGRVAPEFGFHLAMAALALLLPLDVARAASVAWSLLKWLWRDPPWRRWNWWLVPVAVLNPLLMLGWFGAAVWMGIEFGMFPDRFPLAYREVESLAALCSVLLGGCLCGLAGWAIWERHGFGGWLHLLVGAVPGTFFLSVANDYGIWTARWWVIPAFVVYVAWWLYGLVVGWGFSAQWFHRRPCAGCGQKRWLRFGRCLTCGERLWMFKDQSASPVCLVCGSQPQTPALLCRHCRRTQVAQT